MRAEVTQDAEEFWRWTHGWLERDPVLHSVILTNVMRRRNSADPPPGTYVPARNVDLRLAEGRAHVWDHSGPVSYVGTSANLAGLVRIAPTRGRTTSTRPSATVRSRM